MINLGHNFREAGCCVARSGIQPLSVKYDNGFIQNVKRQKFVLGNSYIGIVKVCMKLLIAQIGVCITCRTMKRSDCKKCNITLQLQRNIQM